VASADPPGELTLDDLFTCRQCGDCCRGYGGTRVSPGDIAAIAAFVGLSERALVDTCCQASGTSTILAQHPSGYCIFWDGLCTIHPVKPRMCRRWPFIDSVLVDPVNWLIMAGFCPGMRTDAPGTVIRKCVAKALEAECRGAAGPGGR
jgi:hypothetical protein